MTQNAATAPEKRMKRTLYWYPPWVIIIVLFSLLIGLIVAMIVRKTAKVEVGLCDKHRAKRMRAMLIGALLAIGGFALLIAAIINSWGYAVLGAIVALIAGVVVMIRATLLTVKKMDDRIVWVKGVCSAYLDMLPEWHEGF